MYRNLLKAFQDLHGIQYIVNKELPLWQRIIWAILVAATILGVLAVWLVLSLRYNSNLFQTVIESTTYSVRNIPFPAVTLCNSNRLNLERSDESVNRFIPNATEESKKLFKQVLSQLDVIRFGWFHNLGALRSYNLTEMNNLNLTEVFLYTMFTCEELFVSCVWNDVPQNCCEIFSIQRTDFGLCYSYNSMLSMDAFDFQKVITHRNYEWPTSEFFIPVSNSVRLKLRPNLYVTSEELHSYPIEERQCLFHVSHRNEANRLHKYLLGRDFPYFQTNCIVECRRFLMAQYCNCTVDLFYPSHPYRPCNITGLLCMNKFNEASSVGYGKNCSCLLECNRIEYETTIGTNLIWEAENKSLVNLNVYFKSPTLVKYRTELSFKFLQLIANIGGVLSFFFGASILSVAEIIHRLVAMNIRSLYNRIKNLSKFRNKVIVIPFDTKNDSQTVNNRTMTRH